MIYLQHPKIIRNSAHILKKVKVAHTVLPSVEFRSWSQFLAVSLQVTWVINLAVTLQLLSARPTLTPTTLKRAATSFAAWWTEAWWVWAVCLKLLPDSDTAAIWTRALLRLSPATLISLWYSQDKSWNNLIINRKIFCKSCPWWLDVLMWLCSCGWHEGDRDLLVRSVWRWRTVALCGRRHPRHCSGSLSLTYLSYCRLQ